MDSRVKRGKRYKILVIVGLIFAISILTAVIYYLQTKPAFTPPYIANTVLIYVIFNINIILVFVLLVILFRNVVKLYIERKKRILGSKFKTKLVITFIGLSLIPTILLFLVASDLILKSVDRWLSTPVTRMTESAGEIAEEHFSEYQQQARDFAQDISTYIAAENLLEKKYWLQDRFLKSRLKDSHLDVVNIYLGEEELLPPIINPQIPVAFYRDVPPQFIKRALKGEAFYLKEPMGNGLLLRSGVPILSSVSGDRPVGVAVVGFYVSPTIAIKAGALRGDLENHQQTLLHKKDIKTSFLFLFSMISLVIIFSAVWLGLYLAKGITVPIQKLAQATREISAGNLDYQIQSRAGDEMGVLLDSFNLMTQELKASKQEIEQSNIELQQTTLELERRGSYIETLLENITAGIISLNKDGEVSTINPAASKMLHLDGMDLIGVNYKKVFSAPRLRDVRKIIRRVRQTHDPFLEMELTLLVDQKKSTFSFNFITLKDKDERYLGLVIVLDDLTELLQAQKMAAWRDVARRLAHEIKNPLTPIQLSAERVRKKYSGKRGDGKIIDECTRTIVQQANVLKALVDEFSQFARMPEAKPVLCNLHDIIEDTLLLYEGNTGKVQIERKFSPHLPEVRADPEQMKRVFVNLLDNAIEEMNEGGKVVISSSYDPTSQVVQVAVSDHGSGVKPEDKDKLFMPYFSTKPKGTGLGLSIVSRIVSDHHGTIRVEENHPRGTKFIIELPLKG